MLASDVKVTGASIWTDGCWLANTTALLNALAGMIAHERSRRRRLLATVVCHGGEYWRVDMFGGSHWLRCRLSAVNTMVQHTNISATILSSAAIYRYQLLPPRWRRCRRYGECPDETVYHIRWLTLNGQFTICRRLLHVTTRYGYRWLVTTYWRACDASDTSMMRLLILRMPIAITLRTSAGCQLASALRRPALPYTGMSCRHDITHTS